MEVPAAAPLCGDPLGLDGAALLLVAGADVAAPGFGLDVWPFAVGFFAPGCTVPLALPAAAGVGDGVGVALVWPLALGFCAVAIVAMAVASARTCISFISIPFVAIFIESLTLPELLELRAVRAWQAQMSPGLQVHG